MKVLKFGGTSVGTVDSLKNVKKIVDALDEPAVVVVSALGGLTDCLIATARKAEAGEESFKEDVVKMTERHLHIINSLVPSAIRPDITEIVISLLTQLERVYLGVSLINELSERQLDKIVSFGERMSSVIVAAILQDAVHADSLSFMKTEKWFDKNIASRELTDSLIRETFRLPLQKTVVTGGFISRDKDTDFITNLGRGGSDYTAALIAAALNADSLEIWTDVDGFMTADPRIIPSASVIQKMSFIESMELCSFGAKVIYPPTIYPVFHKNIPIKILNTHNPSAPGTLITDNNVDLNTTVRGVSSIKKTAIVNVTGALAENVARLNSRSYNAMARNGISIFVVAQPDDDRCFSIAMDGNDVEKALSILKEEFAPELQSGEVAGISDTRNLAIVAVVRENIKQIKGLGPRLLNTLLRDGVEVKAVSDGPSETTLSFIISDEDNDKALRLIHNACFSL
ncbi:MAG: aspartate kinase [Bacteroidales bacterium]|nr:aspartate kinase [Bacteroidales bacterium]MBD5206457.1 aspartate kinase [Bacteroidales bacterium]